MNIFKKSLAILLTATLPLIACWYTEERYNLCYIAGVNNEYTHYTETNWGTAYATYYNGHSVSFPLTVYVKLHNDGNNITKAVLQYRVKRNSSWITGWITVRTINNPSYTVAYDRPWPIFGEGSLDPKNLQQYDEVYIRLYVTNGIIESGDLNEALDSISLSQYESLRTNLGSGWSTPFVYKVIYNGVRRIGWPTNSNNNP